MTAPDINVDEYTRGAWLEKDDFPAPTQLTIIGVEAQDIEGDNNTTSRKLVIQFAGQDRKMILNKTNIGILKEAHGSMASGWIGQQIVLYVDPNVSFGGKRVGGLRVQIPAPAVQPVVAPVASADLSA